jgi:hypothetical protein
MNGKPFRIDKINWHSQYERTVTADRTNLIGETPMTDTKHTPTPLRGIPLIAAWLSENPHALPALEALGAKDQETAIGALIQECARVQQAHEDLLAALHEFANIDLSDARGLAKAIAYENNHRVTGTQAERIAYLLQTMERNSRIARAAIAKAEGRA